MAKYWLRVLQGEILSNGSVEWQKGWSVPSNAVVTDIELVGTDLYLASNNRGLRLLDTTTGVMSILPTGIHNFQDEMKLVDLICSLDYRALGSSSAGVQIFNT